MRRGVILLLWLLSGPAAASALAVFVSIPPQQYFVERIGGERVAVSVMLEPGHAPETWEPSPRKVAALQAARIYFRIGVPFERGWLGALPEGPAGFTLVDSGPPRAAADAHADPHAWVTPEDATRIAESVRAALCAADPEGADFYAANHARLQQELALLERDIRAQLAKPRTRYFLISHDSLGRFAAAYGLQQVALEEGGREVGPRRLAEIIALARTEQIRTVLVQRQYHSATARTLARELGAEVIEIDPLAADYAGAMRAIARAVARATD